MQAATTAQRALQIDPEFENLLPALTAEESAALEASIEAEGCRDALIAWGDTLVDGHNRYKICNRRGFAYNVRQMEFDSREDVIIWICDNQNARRNITENDKTYLLGRRYEAEKKKARNPTGRNQYSEDCPQSGDIPITTNRTAERIASELGVGKNTVLRAGNFAKAVDTLAAESPTIKRKILSGEVKQARTAIVEIAAKPEAERREAVEKMERGEMVEVKAKAEKPPKPEKPEPTEKECATCGRVLPIDCFSTQGAGYWSPHCRECRALQKSTGKTVNYKEDMKAITRAYDSLVDVSAKPEYTLEDIYEEIRVNAARLIESVEISFQQHPELFNDTTDYTAFNEVIKEVSVAIDNLRRN